MTRSIDEVRGIIRQAFQRISSDGQDLASASFTDDAIYDFPYFDIYIRGSAHLDIVFSQVMPCVLRQLRQWPIAIYPVADDEDTVLIEYASHATSVHSGSTYRNRYAAVMKLSGERIDFWREYYNVEWFDTAVGPEFPELIAAMIPSDGDALQSRDDSNARRWKSQWVLEEFEDPPA